MFSGGERLKLRLILGSIIVILALALTACGGGDDEGDEENGGDNGDGAAATKTAEAEKTDTPEVVETQEPEKTEEPSGGGGGSASLDDIPVYPGADKTGDWSGSDAPIPLVGGDDVDLEDWEESEWATYETSDEWDTVADFYKDKMPDNGWEEEGWSDISFGGGVAWGGYTRDGGDSAAWVFVSGYEDEQTQIVIGAAHK
jgi:hypothetical protein